MVVYHCRSVELFLIQSVRGALRTVACEVHGPGDLGLGDTTRPPSTTVQTEEMAKMRLDCILRRLDVVSEGSEVSLVFRWGKIGLDRENVNEEKGFSIEDIGLSFRCQKAKLKSASNEEMKLYINWSARGSYSSCANFIVQYDTQPWVKPSRIFGLFTVDNLQAIVLW